MNNVGCGALAAMKTFPIGIVLWPVGLAQAVYPGEIPTSIDAFRPSRKGPS